MKVIYLNNCKIYSGIYDSHVLKLLENLNERNITTGLISFVNSRVLSQKSIPSALNKTKTQINDDLLRILPRPSYYRGKTAFLKASIVALSSMGLLTDTKETIILHAQNYLMSYVGCKIASKYPHIKCYVDIKGIVPEETLYYGEDNICLRIIKFLSGKVVEKYIMKNGDWFSCVSTPFVNYLSKKYNIPPYKINWVPSCVDSAKFYYDEKERKEVRSNLGLNDDNIVLVYSGATQFWQLPHKIIKIYKILKNKNKHIKLMILSKHTSKFKTLLLKHNVDPASIIMFSLPYDEVGKYLMAADIGLLIRKEDLINKVASPTKFPEYLRAGLRIILTKNIGDCDTIVKRNKIGWIINDINNLNCLSQISQEIIMNFPLNNEEREKISEIGKVNYDWSFHIEKVIKSYQEIDNK